MFSLATVTERGLTSGRWRQAAPVRLVRPLNDTCSAMQLRLALLLMARCIMAGAPPVSGAELTCDASHSPLL